MDTLSDLFYSFLFWEVPIDAPMFLMILSTDELTFNDDVVVVVVLTLDCCIGSQVVVDVIVASKVFETLLVCFFQPLA